MNCRPRLAKREGKSGGSEHPATPPYNQGMEIPDPIPEQFARAMQERRNENLLLPRLFKAAARLSGMRGPDHLDSRCSPSTPCYACCKGALRAIEAYAE